MKNDKGLTLQYAFPHHSLPWILMVLYYAYYGHRNSHGNHLYQLTTLLCRYFFIYCCQHLHYLLDFTLKNQEKLLYSINLNFILRQFLLNMLRSVSNKWWPTALHLSNDQSKALTKKKHNRIKSPHIILIINTKNPFYI